MVLNRWGNVIHIVEGGTEVELWDGTDMNGERVVEGVYFYKISGRLLDGEDSEKHGNITVIRDQLFLEDIAMYTTVLDVHEIQVILS